MTAIVQVRALDFADHAYLAMEEFVMKARRGESVTSSVDTVSAILLQCIFFLSSQRNVFLDALNLPLPNASKSLKAKQKLLREQNVLQVVSEDALVFEMCAESLPDLRYTRGAAQTT